MAADTQGPKGASEAAIREHYDVGNGFFAAWLDESMTYSAARWDDGPAGAARLNEAQLSKIDWHLDAVGVSGGSLLDIGCGWGGLLRRAATARAVRDMVGVTASKAQADWIQEHNETMPIEVMNCVWQEASPKKTFDAIISIGALEHFAPPGLSSEQRIRIYEDFFAFCHRHLQPGGRMSLQFIAWMDLAGRTPEQVLPLDLFPQSALPFPIEVFRAADPHFHLLTLENRPSDYSKTLAAWLEKLSSSRDHLIAQYGKDLVKRHIRGFRRFILGFEGGTIGLFRVALLRR